MKYCELALLLCGSMSQHQNLQMELKTLFFPVANCKVRCHVVVGIECNIMHRILCTHSNVVQGVLYECATNLYILQYCILTFLHRSPCNFQRDIRVVLVPLCNQIYGWYLLFVSLQYVYMYKQCIVVLNFKISLT